MADFASLCQSHAYTPGPGEERITYERSFDNDAECVGYDELKRTRRAAKRQKRAEVHKGYGDECWLCMAPAQGTSSSIGRFYKMFTENYKNLEEDVLYEQLAKMFESQVRGPRLAQGIPCPELNATDIKEHLLEHTLEPSVFVSEEIRFMKSVVATMKDRVFSKTDEDGVLDVKDKRVEAYIKAQKQLVALYNVKVTAMNFHDAKCAVVKR